MNLTGVITVVLLLLCGGESRVSLNRTTPSGLLSVCPNATAIFTCRVTGPNIIALNCTEYIGLDQVEFTRARSDQGSSVPVLRGVVTLTKRSNNVLESQLLIHAATVNSSIGCNSGHASSGKTMNLTVYNGFPGIPKDISATEILFSDGSCTILVDWDPPIDASLEDISHYIVRDSINGVHNKTKTTSTRATLRLSQCMDNLHLSVSTVDRCGQEGPSSNVKPKHLQIPETNPATTATTLPAVIATSSVTSALMICALAIMLLILSVYHYKGKYLSINDQYEVKNAVKGAEARWRNIGNNLGFQDFDLDKIEEDHDDPEPRFTALLKLFLNRKKPKPTWKQLAKAIATAFAY